LLEGRISGPISDNWKASAYGDWERQGLGWEKSIIPGRPEEGNVLNKWYVEGQLEGTIGSHVDVWAQVSAIAWNNGAGDAGSGAYGWTPSGFPTFESSGGLNINLAMAARPFLGQQALRPTHLSSRHRHRSALPAVQIRPSSRPGRSQNSELRRPHQYPGPITPQPRSPTTPMTISTSNTLAAPSGIATCSLFQASRAAGSMHRSRP
jgi:hypothetical protein